MKGYPPFLIGDALRSLLQTGRVLESRWGRLPSARRLSIEFATATKRLEIAPLLEAAVNFYVFSLGQDPRALEQETLARLPPERSRLPSMQKTKQALRQMLAIVSCSPRCIACDHKGDADFVGARNILDLRPARHSGQKRSAHQRDASGQTVDR
jgi:hypothetical protein